ncbi:unnamed protein product [Anisakis simplex]|uniref:Uncharacterized protein n=1 Tax=Anisakis simplex TaxID=6269 RepID=A0A0M3KCT0_ANISI|nr:unnamed protein product [Anisakis simplex]
MYSKKLALPSTENKIDAMLTKPVSLKSIRKRSAPLVEVQNNYQVAIVDHERTNSKRPSTNFDARFIEWQKEAERRTQSHDFECDQYAENFDKILRQAFSRVRRHGALLRLGYRS